MRRLDFGRRDAIGDAEDDPQVRDLLAPSRVELEQRTAEMAVRALMVAAVVKLLLGA